MPQSRLSNMAVSPVASALASNPIATTKNAQFTENSSFKATLDKEVTKYNSHATKIKQPQPENTAASTPLKQLRTHNPKAVDDAYNSLLNKVDESQTSADGMNIALKKLAKEFELQFHALMWQRIRTNKSGDSFGTQIWNDKFTEAVVESDADKPLGDIGQAIYDELKREMDGKNARN
jgi:hypothetical protein